MPLGFPLRKDYSSDQEYLGRHMGKFADIMVDYDKVVLSPDGGIAMRLYGDSGISLKFVNGSYYDYNNLDSLEHQLVSLLRRGWAVRRSARRRNLAEAVGTRPTERPLRSPQERKFREEREKLVGMGFSTHMEVVFTVEDASWEVNLGDDCLDELGEDEFVNELGVTLDEAIRDLRGQISVLKNDIYENGISIPRSWRKS